MYAVFDCSAQAIDRKMPFLSAQMEFFTCLDAISAVWASWPAVKDVEIVKLEMSEQIKAYQKPAENFP